MRSSLACALGAALVLAAGCAGGLGAATAPPPSSATPAATATPTATADAGAGATPTNADGPSEPARIVCEEEAQEDIASVLGVPAVQVGPATYADHVSECRYRYPNGSFDLTVHDYPDDASTAAAYAALARQRGHVRDLQLPGADAFVVTDGSIVMRKDESVLEVDITGLPARFGVPPVSRADAALLINNAILGCWT